MCSSAFSLTVSSPAAEVLLTAGHCGQGHWYNDSSGYGNTWSKEARSFDAMVLSAKVDNQVWDGGWYGTGGQFQKKVKGALGTVAGAQLCPSGAPSGIRCGGRAGEVNVSIDLPGYGRTTRNIQIDGTSGAVLAGNGDSGGPVFSLNGDGVDARGIISGMATGSHEKPRAGEPGSASRKCSSRIFAPDITHALGGLKTANSNRTFSVRR
ncbi:hypothetical protein GCM10010123_33920 [Pilimelia anulata]|uniref:Peptidase S1 domain-containing protein n=1 Tax=Pilimelia anulata TaxID=53371 RepID=A0A8J3FBB8_9ACTN|nr:hypothetical protein [Pilimelia anulata]GGK01160.1 hypothetical protein GCM10010123_33920 [Pilimelia anulata]